MRTRPAPNDREDKKVSVPSKFIKLLNHFLQIQNVYIRVISVNTFKNRRHKCVIGAHKGIFVGQMLPPVSSGVCVEGNLVKV